MATEQSTKTYRGNCHCGAFVYEAEIPEIKSVITCDCSMCFKKGTRYAYAPEASVKIVKGDESDLVSYQFHTKSVSYKFCAHCGSPVLGKGKLGDQVMYGLNVNCIQGVDLQSLEEKFVNGAATGEKHVPPEYSGPEPEAEIEGAKIYHGSCHCGAVGLAIKSKDLHEHPEAAGKMGFVTCDCSICARNGNIWMYPTKKQIVFTGRDNLSYYSFGKKAMRKSFCKTCGVNMSNEWLENGPDIWPINLRVLDNFSTDGLKINHFPDDSRDPPYVNP
ncbi:uncharacterized protein DNG_02497 [Cephalotrichum gorgonifer]|uniref:CENP-V/GFA domain-containing protein n=1 Tax=Cephalotrichum gorgonifer TaxID=2041049 RepID=A0AAE8MTL6_9PEZI|nr:uncharacterized protein DNG_02497 [Cephalotrichum gorgonifer]